MGIFPLFFHNDKGTRCFSRSQYIFERTLNIQFNKVLLNWNETTDVSHFADWQVRKARQLNRLDVELYQFAKVLFAQRFEQLSRLDPLFELNFAS